MSSVLIVEDDHSIQSLVKAVLGREGFDVDVAGDGGLALQMIAAKQYDVVVLDLMMAEVSGVDVLSHLGEVQPATPCVVLISAASEADLDAVGSSMVRAKLRKPFDIQDLVSAVRSCLEDESTPVQRNYPRGRRHTE